ncbi:hypothetical protein M9H77_06807 [Catharanthus roseus]|uniref:Uncharacterized protein n=1 Tax=Catharanthus roseus TaxID=4058 RepID=A0ACC0BTE0_CATRO|nr:hypothetical protein M9H77_06807 [Catharanthus roseus]
MPLLEAIGLTPTGKKFTVATAFICNEQATTYRWVLQQIKHLYFSLAMSTGNELVVNDGESLVIITDRESGLMPMIEDVFSKSYHMLHLGSLMAPGTN